MKPTLALSKNGPRLKLTTKSVNGGYYKGNRVGSMGAHTSDGRYIIDYRKVRTYNCPDLKNFPLTPFVTAEMEPTRKTRTPDGESLHFPPLIDGRKMIQDFKQLNPEAWEELLEKTSSSVEVEQADTQPEEDGVITAEGPGLSGNMPVPERSMPETKATGEKTTV
ncbi:MAG: hypothetical protein Q9227_002557 [Pyrenula ochraceoflavens]